MANEVEIPVDELLYVSFRLDRFNPVRAARGREAAWVCMLLGGQEATWVWMSRSDIALNMEKFGAKPGLLDALAAYHKNERFDLLESLNQTTIKTISG